MITFRRSYEPLHNFVVNRLIYRSTWDGLELCKRSNTCSNEDVTHMTATPSGPDIFPIGSYCHTALAATRHRNKHNLALADRAREKERHKVERETSLYPRILFKADDVTWRQPKAHRVLNHSLWRHLSLSCQSSAPESLATHHGVHTHMQTSNSGRVLPPVARASVSCTPTCCFLCPHRSLLALDRKSTSHCMFLTA